MENKKTNNTNKAKGGRPAKGKDKLTIPINLKLTAKDYNSVKQTAEKLAMTPTQYAREMTLKGSIKSRFTLEELELMRKLAGMANNLNQIAKKANQAGLTNTAMEVILIINQIKNLLDDC